jgi:hypothetical protein
MPLIWSLSLGLKLPLDDLKLSIGRLPNLVAYEIWTAQYSFPLFLAKRSLLSQLPLRKAEHEREKEEEKV